MEHVDSALRYIAAGHVDIPGGALEGAKLVSPSDETLGTLDGIVVDPAARKVRFFLLRSRRSRETGLRLVPATPARLDAEQRTLHVELEPQDLPRFPHVDAETFERFSDDDLIAAVFASHAA